MIDIEFNERRLGCLSDGMRCNLASAAAWKTSGRAAVTEMLKGRKAGGTGHVSGEGCHSELYCRETEILCPQTLGNDEWVSFGSENKWRVHVLSGCDGSNSKKRYLRFPPKEASIRSLCSPVRTSWRPAKPHLVQHRRLISRRAISLYVDTTDPW